MSKNVQCVSVTHYILRPDPSFFFFQCSAVYFMIFDKVHNLDQKIWKFRFYSLSLFLVCQCNHKIDKLTLCSNINHLFTGKKKISLHIHKFLFGCSTLQIWLSICFYFFFFCESRNKKETFFFFPFFFLHFSQ